MNQHLLSNGPLLDANGQLCEAGYATSLVKTYNRAAIRAGKTRIKEWDYYLIYNDRFGIALTLDDNSYMGMISASFLDFEKPGERTVSPMFWLPMGKSNFPASSAAGDVRIAQKGAYGSFTHEGDARRLVMRIENFDDGKPFACDIRLTDEPRDSMVIATPFPQKPTAFYYNQKIIAMRATGTVEYRGEKYIFDPKESFGLLDWGRGVWTYENTWYWSALQGELDGHTFGFNLGYGFGDTSAASENMLFYDGVAQKLDRVVFEIPQKDGKDDFLSPWRFTDNEGRLDLTFTPILDRASKTDVLVICSDQHQVFGRFSGKAVLDDGTALVLNGMLGFAEKVRNKW
ncbi:MAG: DUF2804 domain-containing protein [Clostridia bacterium]|nr:DUF2804 domain-containing protein [Clostridia bacterium]